MRRIVVVGAGLAGLRAAAGLRRHGFDGELVVVGDESYPPYDRPPLSKELLIGSIDESDCALRGADELGATWMLGCRAVGVDAPRKELHLSEGRTLTFDGLVIATGRRARTWPALPPLAGFHTLRSLDDALVLRAAAGAAERVVIIGAGFIGCEVASSLRERGVPHVALVDVAPLPMTVLGPFGADRARRLHAAQGVELHLPALVAGFDGHERVEAVVLDDGSRLEADLVVLAIGSRPNSEWLVGSGLTLVDGNVVCDEHGFARGSDAIVAAGDVAAWPHPTGGAATNVEHWTNAREMADVVSANLLAPAGRRMAYAPVPTFWSNQYDVKIKAVGFVDLADRHEVVETDADGPALIEAYRGDELLGAVAFNRNRRVLEYHRALRSASATPSAGVSRSRASVTHV